MDRELARWLARYYALRIELLVLKIVLASNRIVGLRVLRLIRLSRNISR